MKHSGVIVTAFLILLGVSGGSRASAASALPPLQEGAADSAQTTQAKGLLLKLYMTSARVHDLLGLSSAWKLSASERSQYEQEAGRVQALLQTLEKWRYQFLYHPADAQAGAKTLDALTSLIPRVQEIADGPAQQAGAAAQFKQPLDELSGLRRDLHSLLAERFPSQFPAQSAAQPAPAPAPTVPRPTEAAPAPSATAVPSSKPAPPVQTPVQSVAETASAAPAAIHPEQVKSALRGVFLTDARVSDLLSLIQPAKWKLQPAERQLFNDRLQTLQTQLKTTETWRYQFLYNVGKTKLGDRVAASLGSLIPSIESVGSAVAQYENPSAAKGFTQAASELSGYQHVVENYVAGLKEQYEKALAAPPAPAGGKGLSTERIQAPPPSAPPVRTLVTAAPPLTPAQVKQILHNLYVSEYRVTDLLSQEHPEQWKAPPAERTLAEQARTLLGQRLKELEKWRQRFSEDPGNMYNAFQTYLAVNRIFHPLRVFGREAGRYESENIASSYQRRADDMEAQMNGLIPYVGFILQHADEGLETFQSDLANCQNQLGYAMHGAVHSPAPMRNIVPVFQGRHGRRKAKQERK